MKSNVIITASDRRYGDFLIEHWLTSLRENADLSDIDVAVLDYGLSVAQRFYLAANGCLVYPGKRDGHPAVIRYRELRAFLQAHGEYSQAALCDSGDIIFQGDIADVFAKDGGSFRAVCEDYKPFFSFFISSDFFDSEDRERLSECFVRNPMINGGFVVAPREKMIALADECLSVIKDMTKFGPDQIVLNDLLYRDSFVRLDSAYNYVIATAKEGIKIEDGVFFTGEGRKPVVVHNAGNVGALRPVEDFGYGASRNRLKEDVYLALRALYASSEGLFKTQELFLDSRRLFRSQIRKLMHDLRVAQRVRLRR
jgi:hypothetical protein